MDELWQRFTQTGKVEDYLNYKNEEKAPHYADENQGLDNQRTDHRGE
jgi:hypothetical protein